MSDTPEAGSDSGGAGAPGRDGPTAEPAASNGATAAATTPKRAKTIPMANPIAEGVVLGVVEARPLDLDPRDFVKPAVEGVTTVENIFVLTNNGMLMDHFTSRADSELDPDLLSGMLIVIAKFVEDSFQIEGEELKELQFGNYTIIMSSGSLITVAAVVRGPRASEYRVQVEAAHHEIETFHGDIIAGWDGDTDTALPIQEQMTKLVMGGYGEDNGLDDGGRDERGTGKGSEHLLLKRTKGPKTGEGEPGGKRGGGGKKKKISRKKEAGRELEAGAGEPVDEPGDEGGEEELEDAEPGPEGPGEAKDDPGAPPREDGDVYLVIRRAWPSLNLGDRNRIHSRAVEIAQTKARNEALRTYLLVMEFTPSEVDAITRRLAEEGCTPKQVKSLRRAMDFRYREDLDDRLAEEPLVRPARQGRG